MCLIKTEHWNFPYIIDLLIRFSPYCLLGNVSSANNTLIYNALCKIQCYIVKENPERVKYL